MKDAPHSRRVVFVICMMLAIGTWAVFGQTLRHQFVNYDDNAYVYENPHVIGGLTINGLSWALTHTHSDNWHPLTSLSHMLDCEMYGLRPWGHHLTNVLLHTVAVILCFLVLWQMTGFLWRSAFVAAVFAIHPLRVESVAWVAERKDVLSGVFFMLTLGAYLRYVRNPPSLFRYLTVVAVFAAGLMSKPTLVTMPFVLLLLDYWPLRRFTPQLSTGEKMNAFDRWKSVFPPQRLILEKLPLLLLSAASCVATLLAQKEAILSIKRLPFLWRVNNAVVSYIDYVGQMFDPTKLAVFYPYPRSSLPLWQVSLATALLVAITVGVFVFARKRPYLPVGWLWYLGMLTPVIGLVQVGSQAHADRYTYLPQIGLYLLATWAISDISARWRWQREILTAGETIAIAALVWAARTQVSYWRDSESLWTHTLAVTSDDEITRDHLGSALGKKERLDEAITHLERALQINPNYADSHNNLAIVLAKKQLWNEAIAHYQKALEIRPDYSASQYNLGNVFLKTGHIDEALTHYKKALEINPDYTEAHNNLGNILLQKRQVDEAMVHYQKALRINPNYADAQNNLGNLLIQMGRVGEALVHFQKALEIKPNYVEAHNNLANVLLRMGNVNAAIAHCQKALEINPNYTEAHYNLGNAFLAKEQWDDAIIQYRKTLEMAPDYGGAHYNLGNSLLQKGALKEAISQYEQAVHNLPGSADAHNRLALALYQNGQTNDAITHWKEALAIQPGHVEAGNGLAVVLLKTGHPQDAIAHWEQILKFHSDSVQTQLSLAWLFATSPEKSIRNGTRAVELAQQAQKLSGQSYAMVFRTLAAAFAECSRFTEATEMANRGLRLASFEKNPTLTEALQSDINLYRTSSPLRDTGQGGSLQKP